MLLLINLLFFYGKLHKYIVISMLYKVDNIFVYSFGFELEEFV